MALPKADVVLRGGRVFQGLHDGFASAVALWGDRVLAAGGDRELDALIGPATRVVELAGRCVVPGFNDAHEHLQSLGLSLLEVDLRGDEVKTLDELLRRIRERVERTKPGEWVIGGRYDHYQLDVKRHPFREELDRIAPDNPVYVRRTCGHMGVANSLALKHAGISERTPQPPGGNLETQNGRLTGLLQERAQELVARVIPKLALGAMIDGLEAGGRLLLSQGVTSVMDAGVGLRQGIDDYYAYVEARRQARLPVRAVLALTGGPNGIQDQALAQGLRSGVGDDWLRVGPVKLFTDGSAGGLTAAMTVPYKCRCENRGIFIWTDDQLDEMVARYNREGLQIAIHAIGDAAIGQALAAITKADRERGVDGRRFRIEHCGFVTPSQIATMRGLGMTLAPQPIFLYEFGDLYIDVLGDTRPFDSHPMRTWIDAGLAPAASSDAPVSDSNPMINLYAMVTRRSNRGTSMGDAQRISLAEAVHCLTHNGARASFDEARKGRLVAGQLADLAVLERDIFASPPETWLATRVDLTFVGGTLAFDRLGALH
jgi:predicted amidohydrolase YtcJ